MRAIPASGCSSNLNPDGILAIVRYDGVNDDTADPSSTGYDTGTTACFDESGLVPVVPRDVGYIVFGQEVDISVITDNYVKFTINGSSLLIDWDNPTLLLAESSDPSYPTDYN